MITLDPSKLTVPVLQKYLQNSIAPRPICFASTVDKEGRPNLAPFSFFNIFSSNPPVAVFSPALSGRTGAPKDTLLNVQDVPEVVINLVDYKMVHQMSLASSPFQHGVNEFIKAGFTPIESDLIKPYRVKESPVQMECRVNNIIALGDKGGAGNLVICEIVRIHIQKDVLNADQQIDTRKIDLIARMGDNWYCRANGDALFEVQKPITTIGIGIDQLPEHIRNSQVLSGNNLGLLASVEEVPSKQEADVFNSGLKPFRSPEARHLYAKTLLEQDKVKEAWLILLGE